MVMTNQYTTTRSHRWSNQIRWSKRLWKCWNLLAVSEWTFQLFCIKHSFQISILQKGTGVQMCTPSRLWGIIKCNKHQFYHEAKSITSKNMLLVYGLTERLNQMNRSYDLVWLLIRPTTSTQEIKQSHMYGSKSLGHNIMWFPHGDHYLWHMWSGSPHEKLIVLNNKYALRHNVEVGGLVNWAHTIDH